MVASIFTDVEVEFIKNNYISMDTSEIASILGKTKKQIKGKADGLKLRKGIEVTRFSDEEILFLTENYADMETAEMSKVIGKTVKQINDKASTMKLIKKNVLRYDVDENYFKQIDTEEKAYWLGFIYADGCIVERYNKESTRLKSMRLEIGLSSVDEAHLNKFSKSIGFTGTVKRKKVKLNGKIFDSSRVVINNTRICKDLIKLGCTPRKSLTITFPNSEIVPENLLSHFVRGYFDGDGCVSYNHDNIAYVINFVGTKNFLDGIYETVSKEIDITRTTMTKKGNAFQMSWHGFSNYGNWNLYLYKNANIWLDRKNDKFEDAINTKEYINDIAYYHRNVVV